jgi:hypothetical protein
MTIAKNNILNVIGQEGKANHALYLESLFHLYINSLSDHLSIRKQYPLEFT